MQKQKQQRNQKLQKRKQKQKQKQRHELLNSFKTFQPHKYVFPSLTDAFSPSAPFMANDDAYPPPPSYNEALQMGARHEKN